MNEKTLASSIDALAERKAEDFLSHVKVAVEKSLKDAWRPTIVGGKEHLGSDIQNVLRAYASSIGRNCSYEKPEPTKHLIDSCRATIINDLLENLPRLKELALMQLENGE